MMFRGVIKRKSECKSVMFLGRVEFMVVLH